MEIMAAERELSELDEQFSGLISQDEISDAMQIHSGDEDMSAMDDNEDIEGGDDTDFDAGMDDESFGDESFDGDDFEE